VDKFSSADYVNLGFFVSTPKNSIVRGLDSVGATTLVAVLVTAESVTQVHMKYVEKEVRMRV